MDSVLPKWNSSVPRSLVLQHLVPIWVPAPTWPSPASSPNYTCPFIRFAFMRGPLGVDTTELDENLTYCEKGESKKGWQYQPPSPIRETKPDQARATLSPAEDKVDLVGSKQAQRML